MGRSGLTARLLGAAAAIVAAAALVYGALVATVLDLREGTEEAHRLNGLLETTTQVRKSVLDLETGVRAYAITRQEAFLAPWYQARGRFETETRRLMREVAGGSERERLLAERIRALTEDYFSEHSLPLVRAIAEAPPSGSELIAATSEGKRRVDRLRALIAQLLALSRARVDASARAADTARTRAVVIAGGGLALLLLVLASTVSHFARLVTRPVARVSEAAAMLAAGRHHERLPALPRRAAREIHSLTTSFDTMAATLEDQRVRLERHNASLARRLRQSTADVEAARYEMLLMLAAAAEYRDDDTHRHTERVGRNAALIGGQLGLAEETVELLRLAAPLHDVGKIGISDAIMLKPGRLTEAEFAAMRQHVNIGAAILGSSSAPLFHVAAEIAATHHERWDGKGYLQGLSGDSIPLAGRIVAVVDVFDALTHERPYKEAWPLERAREEILRGAGGHFDPSVVAAFEALDAEMLLADPV